MIATRNFHAVNLSCNKQLMFSNQNTHTFRPNSIIAPCKAQWRLHRADFLVFLIGTLVSLPSSLFVEAENMRRSGAVVDSCSKQRWSGHSHDREPAEARTKAMVPNGACIGAINLRFVTQHIQRQSQENAILPKSTS